MFSARINIIFFSRCFTRLRVKIPQLRTCSLPSPCPQPYCNSNSSSIFSFSPRRESSMRALYIIKRRTRTAQSFTVYVPITSCLSCVIKKFRNTASPSSLATHRHHTRVVRKRFLRSSLRSWHRKEKLSERPLHSSRHRHSSTQYTTWSVVAKPCRNLSREKKKKEGKNNGKALYLNSVWLAWIVECCK